MSIPANVAPCNYQQRLILQSHQGRQTIRKPCPHLNAVNDVYCVFHSKDTKHKGPAFRRAFKAFLSEDQSQVLAADFAGFVWPDIDFAEKQFPRDADFSDCVFTKNVSFKNAVFQRSAGFSGCLFEGDAMFHHAWFHGLTNFTDTQFVGNACFDDVHFDTVCRFDNAVFKQQALFFYAIWEQEAGFHHSRFGADAGFNGARFKHTAAFNNAQFEGPALFRECRHKHGAVFLGARFRDAIYAESGHFRYLRMQNLPKAGTTQWALDLSGSILDGAVFGTQQTLERVNFRNALLLGVSFSDCHIIDCDFTGAVLYGTHLRLSSCDDATRHATRYIYTDYEVHAVNRDGKRGQELRPLAAARVPIRGEFGKEAHFHLDFHKVFAPKYRWSFSLEIPMAIRLTVVDYLNLFVEYMSVVEGVQTDLKIYREGRTMRFDFLTESDDQNNKLRATFRVFAGAGFAAREVAFHNDRLIDMDRNLFHNRLNHRLSQLHHEALAAKKLLQSVFRELQDKGNVHKSKRFPGAYQTVKLFAEDPARLLLEAPEES